MRSEIDAAIAAFDLRAATGAIVAEIDALNRCIETVKPWTLAGTERTAAVDDLACATRAIVDELQPFVPDLAARAAARLAGGSGAAP